VTALARRRGAVDIASASGTEEPGSNPARVSGFRENIAKLFGIFDLNALFVCLKKI
jgi:hypothetical protein